jgi:D-amino-acid dehydrogenase
MASAHLLAQRGWDVTVVERQRAAGNECSFGNAQQLTQALVNIRPKTATPLQLLDWATSRRQPVSVGCPRTPADWAFCTAWLRHGLHSREAQSRAMHFTLALSQYSMERTVALAQAAGLDAQPLSIGHVHTASSAGQLVRLAEQTSALEQGLLAHDDRSRADLPPYRTLAANETLVLEPALTRADPAVAGSLYHERCLTYDPSTFCKALAKHWEACAAGSSDRSGGSVRFLYAHEVVGAEFAAGTSGPDQVLTGLRARPTGPVAVGEQPKLVEADEFVLCGGIESSQLCALLGGGSAGLPLTGLRGHSLTLRDVPEQWRLSTNVADTDNWTYFSPLPPPTGGSTGGMRVAAFGDFFTPSPDRHGRAGQGVQGWRRAQLFAAVEKLFPGLLAAVSDGAPGAPFEEGSRHEIWTGMRPLTPDMVPLIGRRRPGGNLSLNCGHGSLGWTQCIGSAEVLVAGMMGEEIDIGADLSAAAADRF